MTKPQVTIVLWVVRDCPSIQSRRPIERLLMIVVTTPTGNIGHQVVQHLLDAGEALRVIVRNPAKLPQTVRD